MKRIVLINLFLGFGLLVPTHYIHSQSVTERVKKTASSAYDWTKQKADQLRRLYHCAADPDTYGCSKKEKKSARNWILGAKAAAVASVLAAIGLTVTVAGIIALQQKHGEQEGKEIIIARIKTDVPALKGNDWALNRYANLVLEGNLKDAFTYVKNARFGKKPIEIGYAKERLYRMGQDLLKLQPDIELKNEWQDYYGELKPFEGVNGMVYEVNKQGLPVLEHNYASNFYKSVSGSGIQLPFVITYLLNNFIDEIALENALSIATGVIKDELTKYKQSGSEPIRRLENYGARWRSTPVPAAG